PIWNHTKFEQSPLITFSDSTMRFNYDSETDERYLFNINPPQQPRWAFSSPMRIARAALLGQIPVVTKKLADHDIEDIALLWDGRRDSAFKIMSYRMDRKPLLQTYIQSVRTYNGKAKEKNQQLLEAIELLSASDKENSFTSGNQ